MTFLDFIRTNGYRFVVPIFFYVTGLHAINIVGYVVSSLNPLCVQSQVCIRHPIASLVRLIVCFIVPTVEPIAFTSNFCISRKRQLHLGVNLILAVAAVSKRTAVRIISQIMRSCGNINLNGSIALVIRNLSKIKAKLILTIYLLRLSETLRVKYYTINHVIRSLRLTNTYRRNINGRIVPERLTAELFTSIETILNNNLISYAAAFRILYPVRFSINSPVGHVNLNHLRILSANQIVEYKLRAFSKCSPLRRILCLILKLTVVVANIGDFGTLSGLVIATPVSLLFVAGMHTSLPENGVVGRVCSCFALSRCEFGNSLAIADNSFVDGHRVAIVTDCPTVGQPIFSLDGLNLIGININCVIAITARRCNFICRRIAYCIIILRIIFIGIAIIASLLDVRTAGRCLCRIRILNLSCLCSILRLSLSLSLGIGSFLNGVFCGSTVNNRHLVFR